MCVSVTTAQAGQGKGQGATGTSVTIMHREQTGCKHLGIQRHTSDHAMNRTPTKDIRWFSRCSKDEPVGGGGGGVGGGRARTEACWKTYMIAMAMALLLPLSSAQVSARRVPMRTPEGPEDSGRGVGLDGVGVPAGPATGTSGRHGVRGSPLVPRLNAASTSENETAAGGGSPVKVKGAEEDTWRELWLNDFTKDFLNEMQADGVRGAEGGRRDTHQPPAPVACPPPFLQAPRDACRVVTCTSDTECHVTGQKCCNNGCIFTCMEAIPPPPLVDWKKEPRRKEKGISWLLPASNITDNLPAEHCSTSQLNSDEDVLLCPHGYLCHIEFLGDAARGIPNRGRCMPEVHDAQGSAKTRFRIQTKEGENTRCRIPSRGLYPNGARFRYETHMCTCHDGSVECQVGRRRG